MHCLLYEVVHLTEGIGTGKKNQVCNKNKISVDYYCLEYRISIKYGEQEKKKKTSQKAYQKVYLKRGKKDVSNLVFHGQKTKSLMKTFRVKK